MPRPAILTPGMVPRLMTALPLGITAGEWTGDLILDSVEFHR